VPKAGDLHTLRVSSTHTCNLDITETSFVDSVSKFRSWSYLLACLAQVQAFVSIAVQRLFCAGEGGWEGGMWCLSVSFVSVLVLVILW
jgi:hypothetical protein